MKVEVLVATMHQTDFSLVEKMNLHSDAVFANQAADTDYNESLVGDFTYRMITTSTRGVGKNRNLGLMYAVGDILVLADDDLRYFDSYNEVLCNAFEKYNKADIIVFNLTKESGRKMIKKPHRVRFKNSMRYGAVRMAVRKSALDKANVHFSMLYGGGAKYSSGEDSLFLRECMKSGMRVYAIPDVLADLTFERGSTWDYGDNKKKAFDKGVWLKNAFPHSAFLLKYVFAYKMRNDEFGFRTNLKLLRKGIRAFKKRDEEIWQ